VSAPLYQRFGRGLLEQRWATGGLALLLLAASLFLGWQSERRENAERYRQVTVQARILGTSVASALAFDDDSTARDYLAGLRLNPSILAAGVYDETGRLVAGYARPGQAIAQQASGLDRHPGARQVSAFEPVKEGGLELGHVYVRASVEPISARLSRYLAIGILLVLAALSIAILGASNAASAAANRALQSEIAAREKAQAALRQAQKMEVLGQLTGGVAHDFNNLLMAASSGLELMERAKTEDRRKQLMSGIGEALQRGARITGQLLAFARRSPMQNEVVQLEQRIDKLAELLDHSLREDVSVKFDIGEDLWPVRIDLSQFEVAILNLAVNAKDAMPSGGLICIAAQNSPGGLDGADAVEVSVADEGEGMSPEAIEKAFEPFFTTKEIGRGTGLGLSQVYGFVQALGGTVAITSPPGDGTTVTMVLPRAQQDAGTVSTQPARSAQTTAIAGLRVMLVEDDEALNELVGEMLVDLGIDVARAGSAAEGLSLFAAGSFDLVVSDMVMPGKLDGLGLARQLRSERADLPVLLMTGYSNAADAALADGFRVLRKPFSSAELAAALGEAAAAQARP
jgi:signal transduction histidine kinase/ActR/RegA family two-component response regulator